MSIVNIYIAKDGDDYCLINDAVKGHKYICIDCEGTLIPKKGYIKAHHYAHLSDPCSGESWQHIFCKKIICKYKSQIEFRTECFHCFSTTNNLLLKRYDVVEEYPLTVCENSYRLDCGVVRNNKLKGAIEIKHTHEVTVKKKRDLINSGIVLYEILTAKLIDLYEHKLKNGKNVVICEWITKQDCRACRRRAEKEQEEERKQKESEDEKQRKELEKKIKRNESRENKKNMSHIKTIIYNHNRLSEELECVSCTNMFKYYGKGIKMCTHCKVYLK